MLERTKPTRTLFPAITKSEIEQIESHFRHPLPMDYRDFLLEFNGAFFQSPLGFHTSDGDDEDDYPLLYRLYGMCPSVGVESTDDVRFAGRAYDFQNRVPEGIVAIGDDNSWNFVCLSLRQDTCGSIYYWEPGEPWEMAGSIRTWEFLSPVAATFREFCDRLFMPRT
ncbi:MAG: SMI1/KNR4 family protein [Planctomycetales bacterium]|nr:SMI1/KNR4 family protein [Planctomycetales bacterium]